MTVTGVLKLAGAKITGAVELAHARLLNPAAVALDARFLQARALALLPKNQSKGSWISAMLASAY
jgi:hypothetical protein